MQVDIIFQHYYQVAEIRSIKKIPYPNFGHPTGLAFCKIKQNMAALWLVCQPDRPKIIVFIKDLHCNGRKIRPKGQLGLKDIS